MRAYVIRRLLLIIPTIVLVTIILFLMIRLMPGSVVDLMIEEQRGIESFSRAELEHMLGLDVPIHVQYGHWIERIIMHGDLGSSLWTKRPLIQEIKARIPVTFELGLLAVIIANLIAFPVGLYSAIRQDTWGDYLGRTFAILSLATPAFWLATMIIVYGSIWWNWSPPVKYIPFIENPVENLKILILPAVLVGTAMSGATMRYVRTLMLEVLRQDYVRTAWSKGLKERVVIIRHALRNALIPLITVLVPEIGMLIGGSVIMEQIFCLPGMGRYLLEVITQRDYLMVSGANLIFAVFTMLLILATDISYAYLDPRVRYK